MEHAGRFLRSIRESAGLTQQEIGERLGKPQSEVSEIEQRPNMLLSSFRRYVKAAGAKPVVAAQFPDRAA
ncbi:MAG: helix-turn-helix transcriptional regulator [Gemmatimonadetes bacterium]|nr:helix-turn-helix transcriptional regulator [Gemmatimonadota bacterium]